MPDTRIISGALACLAASCILASAATAQAAGKKPKKMTDTLSSSGIKAVDSLPTSPLFASDSLLTLTFTTNIKQLRGDRKDSVPYRAATMSYTGPDGKTVTVPMRAKTHGVWRLKNCNFPPVRLNVANKTVKGTLFENADKPKFVNACRDNDAYEQLVLQEMQLYRIYQLLTPRSHRVRAFRVTYRDSASARDEMVRYGFVFEDPDLLAARIGGGRMIKTKGGTPDDIDNKQLALVYLFEFMIGNTDFSFSGLHNGELVQQADMSLLIPVAYDFDFSGAVNAPYATVDPQLQRDIKRVRQRLFRGHCVLAPHYPDAAALFLQKKDAIYALYRDDLGKLLDPRIVKETLEYFDEFYDAIKTPGDAQRVFRNCVGPR